MRLMKRFDGTHSRTQRPVGYVGSPLRSRIASVLTMPLVGHLVGASFRDRIPSFGVRIRTDDDLFSPSVKAKLLFRLYESAEIRLVRDSLRGVETVVDLGASLGIASIHALDVMAPTGRLVAVEASPRLFPSLSSRLEEYAGPSQVVETVNAAIAYTVETVQFSEGAESVGGRVSSSVAGQPVKARRLGDVLREANVGTDFSMVCDIEGAEFELVEHDLASLHQCEQLIVELHGPPGGPLQLQLIEDLAQIGLHLQYSRGSVCHFRRSKLP